MTNFLGQTTTGTSQDGQRIVIAAVEGAGKTTLAANAPRTLFVPVEDGAGGIAITKTPVIANFSDLLGLMDEIRAQCMAGKFPFKSISFDSATAIERLIHEHTVATDPKVLAALAAKLKPPVFNMETAHDAYGKAYVVANNHFANLLYRFDELTRNAKINIVITCHTFPSLVRDAAYGEYHSWDLLLHSPKNDKTYGKREMLMQWADFVGFLHEPLFVSKEGGMQKGMSAGQGRQMGVDRTPGWAAKNRYGLTGLIQIPQVNGWNYIADAVWKSRGIDIWNRDV